MERVGRLLRLSLVGDVELVDFHGGVSLFFDNLVLLCLLLVIRSGSGIREHIIDAVAIFNS